MTPDQAADLAARTLTAIDAMAETRNAPADFMHRAADRERIASDLAGLREVTRLYEEGYYSAAIFWWLRGVFADNLRRTADLYGATA